MRGVWLMGLMACGGGSKDTGAEPPALKAVAVPSAWVPSVLEVSWAAPPGATSWVEWGSSADALTSRTPVTQEAEVSVSLLGLAAETDVVWQAVSEVDGTEERSALQTYTVPEPSRLPPLTISTSLDGAELPNGYIMAAASTGLSAGAQALTTIGIWRASDGQPVWWLDLQTGLVTVSPSLSPSEPVVIFDAYHAQADATPEGHRIRLDGSVWSSDALQQGHHAAIETLPGTWAWLAMRATTQSDGRTDLTDLVMQAPVGDTSVPDVVLDHSDDIFGGVAPATCVHNALPSNLTPVPDVYEWVHSNSLVYSPDSDALYVYGRFVDALWKIDRSTGALQWQLGGPNGDFTDPDGLPLWTEAADSRPWSHAHMTDVWDGGALLFDNGDHYSPRASGVVEVAWDEASRTAWEVWRYDSPSDEFMFVLGDARRLPGDHVLISWTEDGRFEEVDRDGVLQWQATLPGALQVSRVRYIEDLYSVGGAR